MAFKKFDFHINIDVNVDINVEHYTFSHNTFSHPAPFLNKLNLFTYPLLSLHHLLYLFLHDSVLSALSRE